MTQNESKYRISKLKMCNNLTTKIKLAAIILYNLCFQLKNNPWMTNVDQKFRSIQCKGLTKPKRQKWRRRSFFARLFSP